MPSQPHSRNCTAASARSCCTPYAHMFRNKALLQREAQEANRGAWADGQLVDQVRARAAATPRAWLDQTPQEPRELRQGLACTAAEGAPAACRAPPGLGPRARARVPGLRGAPGALAQHHDPVQRRAEVRDRRSALVPLDRCRQPRASPPAHRMAPMPARRRRLPGTHSGLRHCRPPGNGPRARDTATVHLSSAARQGSGIARRRRTLNRQPVSIQGRRAPLALHAQPGTTREQ
mmetsp:Transcript_81018/g.229374  ORF Transcript_81018/g.229374 Transcript_81018/m.229374 type:complete len:234 (+) Transcript_81018:294-995(+)